MPTLQWIGKEKVINHHLEVPIKVLEHQYGFNEQGKIKTETGSGNKIIHGDNLEALKALLPEYEGRIKCIYIDPPYNTGNEGWVYNDNVNDPKIKKWLHQVIGKEGDDLSRHDKWLCMIYPRLQLLHKLLTKDGVIFISIDDNEHANLKSLLDEIFGRNNFITNFTWRTEGNFDNQAKIKINHEYILCYCKTANLFEHPKVVDPNIKEGSKLFKDEIRNTIVKNGPKNPISEVVLPLGFPSDLENGVIEARTNSWPH
jgi:adenine specific DNA methylase Mod